MLLPTPMKGSIVDITVQDVSSSISDRSYMIHASTRTLSIHSAATDTGTPCRPVWHRRRQMLTRLAVSCGGIRLSSYRKFPRKASAEQVVSEGRGGLEFINERRICE